MEPRYSRYGYPRPRSPTFNPARASMPSSVGFTSMYGGDIQVMPPSSRYQPVGSRGYTAAGPPANPPAAATTTATPSYAVPKDPLTRGPTIREPSRAHRSSTIDSAATRPVIVTTTQPRTQHGASHSHHTSPSRDEFRASDSQFYTQPASSSIRSRSHHRGTSYAGTTDDYSYLRSADTLLSSRPDPYRPSRPAVLYSGQSRHDPAAIDYGDAGYEYTTPSDLARYDLSHERPSRSRRRESLDRGYHRPTVNVPTDIGRPYANATGAGTRYDSRGGPPPTTRGFDRISRGPTASAPYDSNPLPPSIPPARAGGTYVEPAAPPAVDPKTSRRRPVSVYQEPAPRSSHHEDYYRSREEDRNYRQLKDLERQYDPPYEPVHGVYRDDDIATRGFGILTTDGARADPVTVGSEHDERRETRREYRVPGEDRRGGSDEEIKYPSGRETRGTRDDDWKRSREPFRPEKDTKDPGQRHSQASDEEPERVRFRDEVGTGLGVAAAALGLGHAAKKDETPAEESEKESRRRSQEEEIQRDRDRERRREREKEEEEVAAAAAAAARSAERAERHKAREESTDRKDHSDGETRDRHRREAEAFRGDEPVRASTRDDGLADEDDKTAGKPRRSRVTSAFDPTDTNDLRDLREQLSDMKASDSPKERKGDKPTVAEREEDMARTTRQELPRGNPAALSQQSSSMLVEVDESQARGREVVPRKAEEKQVRVVSPPRDKHDKPLKSILKPPRKFPEEENPIREGVAPHKDDKKLREVPSNARWTKISRRVVNPEALTIGKERFEVRDDFVIVLRVLSSEEIKEYATATAQLREKERERERGKERDRERERDQRPEEDERPRQYRHHRRDDDYERYDEERDRDRERHRRH
ncbi:hypothetical protein SODALDRAFT_284116 [Sodiomyces alkalinus F11]|uniref:DUF8035 domain-containing protein n=1 Tax=Sodiomyces alkalinus (strain CBS 110278 / VKM F-3762 / F11) TaxID=1314773 RepID=A0A3N2PLG9_SODAK|nr:hypothetical protein SODALDRAFT_284116 [Sodiomyces alkalinus F11]ROT35363.1 hypothetical protein SODALDRAFT_284116 [Sodiomyces alkalinus F11]